LATNSKVSSLRRTRTPARRHCSLFRSQENRSLLPRAKGSDSRRRPTRRSRCLQTRRWSRRRSPPRASCSRRKRFSPRTTATSPSPPPASRRRASTAPTRKQRARRGWRQQARMGQQRSVRCLQPPPASSATT